jgi:hypothetical protein
VAVGIAVFAAGLAACSQTGEQGANRGICYDFKTARPAAASAPANAGGLPATTASAPADASSAALDDCVRRWAYSLAPARDSAQMVANAAAAACGTVLGRWNEQALGQGNGTEQAPSITTGQPTNPMEAHAMLAHDRALLYVVEARAGRCAPPPATNGAPQGVTG